MSWSLSRFEQMYAESDDPWSFRSRFYERRKRALTLAALPSPRYRRGLELCCGNGELAAALAERCDTLLACDAVERAVQSARARLSAWPGVRVEQRRMPAQWPDGRFDCIVLSELGYFLEPSALEELYARCIESLHAEGCLLLCHWRHPVEGCALDGDQVHAMFAAPDTWRRLLLHQEDDFVLEVWSPDGRSVARREGLS